MTLVHMRFALPLLLIVQFTLTLAGSAPATPSSAIDSANIVATVNGDPITVTMVERELGRIHMAGATGDTSRADFDLDRLLQRLITDRLLAQEARAIGLHEDSSVIEKVARFRDRSAQRIMVREMLPDTFTATAAELQAEFDHQYRRFAIHMLSVKDTLLAAALLDSIRRGEPLDRLAAAYSIDRFKNKGGDAGAFRFADFPPALQERIDTAHAGTLIGPIGLWRVFCLIRVQELLPADTSVKMDSVRAPLADVIVARKRREAREAFTAAMHAEIPVRVDSAVVDSVLIKMSLGLPAEDRVAATVGEARHITDTDLRNKYIHKSVGRIDNQDLPLLYNVLQEKIESLILEEAAVRRDFAHHPRTDELARAYEDSLLVIVYLQDVVANQVEVTPEEVTAHYEANKDKYRGPARYKIATITRDLPEEAEDDLKQFRDGADFGWLARQNSIDEARERGGELEWIGPERVPGAVSAVLDTLTPGQVTGPVETDAGFVLIKLLDRQRGAILPPERVTDHITAHLRRNKELAAIDEAVRLLRADATIETREEVLQSLQISGRRE